MRTVIGRRLTGRGEEFEKDTLIAQLTTHKAAGRGLEDAGALQALRVGTGGADSGLQSAQRQPVGQPVELAVAQEAVAVNETADRQTDSREVSAPVLKSHRRHVTEREGKMTRRYSQRFETLHFTEGVGLDGADGVVSQVPVSTMHNASLQAHKHVCIITWHKLAS